MAKIKEAIEDLDAGKRVNLWLHNPDVEIIRAMQRRYGCSATAAIRACIRIAADVKLNLDRPAPINTD